MDKDKLLEEEQAQKIQEELKVLNKEFEQVFGFKWVIFVNGRTKEQLLPSEYEYCSGYNMEKDDFLFLTLCSTPQ